MIPTDTIDKLAETFSGLSELGASLTEVEWKQPTEVPRWTVQDHLSHLIGIEKMLEGDPPVAHRADDLAHVKNPIGEMNEHEVDARRGRTGAEVLAEWDDIAARRLATLRNADDAYFAQETMTPTGPGTVADFLHIRVLDCWVHQQDMRRAVGRPGHLDGPAAEHTIDRLLRTLPIVVGKRARAPEGSTVVIELTGPVHRLVPITVTGGRAAVVDRFDGEPLATLRLDSEVFVMLATGRGDAAVLSDRWSAQGDTALGEAIVTQLNMMI